MLNAPVAGVIWRRRRPCDGPVRVTEAADRVVIATTLPGLWCPATAPKAARRPGPADSARVRHLSGLLWLRPHRGRQHAADGDVRASAGHRGADIPAQHRPSQTGHRYPAGGGAALLLRRGTADEAGAITAFDGARRNSRHDRCGRRPPRAEPSAAPRAALPPPCPAQMSVPMPHNARRCPPTPCSTEPAGPRTAPRHLLGTRPTSGSSMPSPPAAATAPSERWATPPPSFSRRPCTTPAHGRGPSRPRTPPTAFRSAPAWGSITLNWPAHPAACLHNHAAAPQTPQPQKTSHGAHVRHPCGRAGRKLRRTCPADHPSHPWPVWNSALSPPSSSTSPSRWTFPQDAGEWRATRALQGIASTVHTLQPYRPRVPHHTSKRPRPLLNTRVLCSRRHWPRYSCPDSGPPAGRLVLLTPA